MGGRLGRGVVLLAGGLTLAIAAGPTGAASKSSTRLEKAPRIALASPKRPRLSSSLARQTGTRSVAVEIEARDPAAARAAVRAAGGRVEASFGRLLEARVPASGIAALGASPAVRFAREPLRPELDSIGGQGVAVTAAAGWHAAGYTGRGVKVAVIDGGFGGLARRQGEGELPRTAKRVDHCSSADFDGPIAVEHGTAVAEIVHEMAPGAELHLICVDTLVGLARAAAYARAKGITVVNHSVSWFNTSRGDGSGGPATPDAIVAEASAAGILWVNSAGNRGQQHWSGTFADADADGWHEFAPNDEGNTISFAKYEGGCVRLKWDDWPSSDTDYDLHLVRTDASAIDGRGAIVASSRNAQTGSQPPTEQLCFSNPGARFPYAIEIVRVSGTGSPRLDLFISPGPDFEHQVAEGSVTEPASSPAVLAVGAVCWLGDTFEAYSSRGPTIDGRLEARPGRAGERLLCDLRRLQGLRRLGLRGHLRRRAARGRSRGARQAGEPELRRRRGARVPRVARARPRRPGPRRALRGRQAAARRRPGGAAPRPQARPLRRPAAPRPDDRAGPPRAGPCALLARPREREGPDRAAAPRRRSQGRCRHQGGNRPCAPVTGALRIRAGAI